MKVCPITYEPFEGVGKYSAKGLKKLAPNLKGLHDLPFSAQAQRIEAIKRADKLSIQGVQPKLSAKLNIAKEIFEFVDIKGKFILKPQHELYPYVCENEDVSMRLAAAVGIETPLHGLISCVDNSFTYFIKRFDRLPLNKKLAVEDFAQLAKQTRDTKYNFSMERIIPLIETYCTFPVIDKKELLTRTVFNFIIGNEDMHLKNFSVINIDNVVRLSPAYDFLNTTIILDAINRVSTNAREEIALPLNGKKNNLRYKDFIDYFAYEKLKLGQSLVQNMLEFIFSKISVWEKLISRCFLPENLKEKYLELIEQRINRIKG